MHSLQIDQNTFSLKNASAFSRGEIQIALQATGILADLGNGESGGGRKPSNEKRSVKSGTPADPTRVVLFCCSWVFVWDEINKLGNKKKSGLLCLGWKLSHDRMVIVIDSVTFVSTNAGLGPRLEMNEPQIWSCSFLNGMLVNLPFLPVRSHDDEPFSSHHLWNLDRGHLGTQKVPHICGCFPSTGNLQTTHRQWFGVWMFGELFGFPEDGVTWRIFSSWGGW